MSILCLDIGTKTGWAIGREISIFSGNAKWPKTQSKKNPQHVGNRFYRFKELLTELKNSYDVTEVHYERSYFGAKGKIAEEVRNQFVGVLLAWACHHDLPVTPVSTSTLRSSYGNSYKREASKKYALKCAAHYYKKPVDSDDEADALMLLRYVIKQKQKSLI